MFIYNLKMNGNGLFKIFFIIISIIVIIFFIFSAIKIFSNMNSEIKLNDEINSSSIANITADNYTNILKMVYENTEQYIGQKICFTGYVHRVSDFTKNQFVLARDMLISSDSQFVIVGFLCENKNALDFPDKTWVEIIGTIEQYNYQNRNVPIIKVTKINTVNKPENEYVYPPDENYIPTAVIF